MIDNITLWVDSPLPKPVSNHLIQRKKFMHHDEVGIEYYVPNKYGNHHLVVRDFGDHFVITNSWRKWFLGSDSLEDLSYQNIAEICEVLAQYLKLKSYHLGAAKLRTVEFGKTFTLNGGTCFSVISNIHSYSTLTANRFGGGQTIAFVGQDFNLMIYDKEREMTKKRPKLKNVLSSNNKLRIELKSKDAKGTKNKFHNINSLQDLLLNYKKMILGLRKEIKKIQMISIDTKFDAISFKTKRIKDLRVYLEYKGIQNIGPELFFKYLKELDYNAQERSRYLGMFRKRLNMFEHMPQYGKKELLRDVTKQLMREFTNPMLERELL